MRWWGRCAWAFTVLMAGCSFQPELAERGWVECQVDADCALACTCSELGLCLPAQPSEPGVCRPGVPGPLSPGELLRLDWADPIATRTLEVNTPTDGLVDLAAGDFDAALGEADADGLLTLREALAVARFADRPARISFDPNVFGSGQPPAPILLTTGLKIPHTLLFLDGSGAAVELAEGGPGFVLSISGQVVAVQSIAVRGATGLTAVDVRMAQGVYLSGLRLENNRVGLLIQDSQLVFFSDAAELFGLQQRRPNLVAESSVAGISVIDSDYVFVTGTRLAGNAAAAIQLSGASQIVGIGPPESFDRRAVSPVIIAGQLDTGIRLIDFAGSLLVRNTVFDGNDKDLYASASQGVIAFLQNTVVHGTHAVAKFEQPSGPTDVYILNSIFEGAPGVQHLYCFGDDSLLTVTADYLMFSQEPLIEACPTFPDLFIGGQHIWSGTDPGFVDPPAGDFHLGPDSPALDVGLEIELESGRSLYLKPDGGGAYCGTAPDLGAYEFCQ